MLEKAWPPASIVQDERNTEQEGDVKRASSSFSMPLLDLIISHSLPPADFFFLSNLTHEMLASPG